MNSKQRRKRRRRNLYVLKRLAKAAERAYADLEMLAKSATTLQIHFRDAIEEGYKRGLLY